MNTTLTLTRQHSSAGRRFFGVVARPQTYRNIAYLLLGLPLGTAWFTLLVTGWSVGIGMMAAALLGIPILLGVWYVTRACANAERYTANALLDRHLPMAPMASHLEGGLWTRLRSTTGDRNRWREVGYLMARFPAGIATFTAATVALAMPVAVAAAPFTARWGGDQPFGTWRYGSQLEDIAGSPWAWLFVPLGLLLMVAAFHALNALAAACGRWTKASLGTVR
jgi:hypothetical protein